MSGRRRAGVVLGGFAVLYALLLGIGLLVTRVLVHDFPVSQEDDVNRALAAHRTPLLNSVTGVFSELGTTPVIIGLVVVVALVMRKAFGRWNESLFVLLATFSQSVVFLLTQLVLKRRRPDVPHLDASPPTSSFPSGHTSASVALYGSVAVVLLWRTRRSWLPVVVAVLLLAVPALVAFSRLYRGMHHPTDVATSLVSGSTCIALSWRALLADGIRSLHGRGPRSIAGDRRRGREPSRVLPGSAAQR